MVISSDAAQAVTQTNDNKELRAKIDAARRTKAQLERKVRVLSNILDDVVASDDPTKGSEATWFGPLKPDSDPSHYTDTTSMQLHLSELTKEIDALNGRMIELQTRIEGGDPSQENNKKNNENNDNDSDKGELDKKSSSVTMLEPVDDDGDMVIDDDDDDDDSTPSTPPLLEDDVLSAAAVAAGARAVNRRPDNDDEYIVIPTQTKQVFEAKQSEIRAEKSDYIVPPKPQHISTFDEEYTAIPSDLQQRNQKKYLSFIFKKILKFFFSIIYLFEKRNQMHMLFKILILDYPLVLLLMKLMMMEINV